MRERNFTHDGRTCDMPERVYGIRVGLTNGKAVVVQFRHGWWLFPMFVIGIGLWALILRWVWTSVT